MALQNPECIGIRAKTETVPLLRRIRRYSSANARPNTIHPGKLGYIQQELLKQAFAQIAAVQKKISYDFLGGV